MDKDAEIKKLVDERDHVIGWQNHPITQSIFADIQSQQEQLITMICDNTVNSIETLFGHFEAIGHLRGLRRAKALVLARLEEIDSEIKNLTE